MPKDGQVDIIALPTVTEKELSEDLHWITVHLDGVYWSLADAMKPFQEEWDQCGNWADKLLLLKRAQSEGSLEGAKAWLEDLGDVFDGETWERAGAWISDATTSVADRIGGYAKEQKKKIGNLLAKPGETVWNWSWWAKQVSDTAASAASTVKSAKDALDTAGKAVGSAYAVWKHREEIARLPEILASGDSKKLQNFVDTVLMEIDPEMAKEIKSNPDFHAILELIDDPDGVLTYLTYTSLMMEAIPPNFYAHVGGKAGTYIVIEVLLMVVLALLGGVGVGARVAALTARLTASAANVAATNKKIAGAKKAIESLTSAMKRLVEVGEDLREYGKKLAFARRRGVIATTATRGTATATRKPQKRERRCKICGSTKHRTPNIRRGNVGYDSKYLTTLKDKTTSRDHPRHQGVKMQAHHVLSREGIRRTRLGEELVQFGYNINTLENLVFIPSTLQGACHLGVQPHRGDHKGEFDDEQEHPITYHDYVARKVKELEPYLKGKCPGSNPRSADKIKGEMDKRGKAILRKIAEKPSMMRLTSVAQHFVPNSPIGCGGVDNVGNHKAQPCPCKCDHQSSQGPNQKPENITFPKSSTPYKLTMGR